MAPLIHHAVEAYKIGDMLAERDVRSVDFTAWQKIEAAEIANAREGAPRKKFVSVAEMLAVLD